MSMLKHRNRIHALMNSQRQYICDCTSIKDAAIDYYQNLFNGDINTVFPHIVTRMTINSNGRNTYLPQLLYPKLKKPYSPFMIQRAKGQMAFQQNFTSSTRIT